MTKENGVNHTQLLTSLKHKLKIVDTYGSEIQFLGR
jgi:hypothetical protein